MNVATAAAAQRRGPQLQSARVSARAARGLSRASTGASRASSRRSTASATRTTGCTTADGATLRAEGLRGRRERGRRRLPGRGAAPPGASRPGPARAAHHRLDEQAMTASGSTPRTARATWCGCSAGFRARRSRRASRSGSRRFATPPPSRRSSRTDCGASSTRTRGTSWPGTSSARCCWSPASRPGWPTTPRRCARISMHACSATCCRACPRLRAQVVHSDGHADNLLRAGVRHRRDRRR